MDLWDALSSDTFGVATLGVFALMQVLGIRRADAAPWWTVVVFLALALTMTRLIIRLNGGAA
jgi:hypothetical protein